MANDYFSFKQFTIRQGMAAFKVTTDSVMLGAWADITDAGTILDIGSGTGILALMAAQRSKAKIVAIEPDEESFKQALSNIATSKWSGRITAVKSSLKEFAGSTEMFFDAVITNPPYFTASLRNPDPRKAMARHNATLPLEELFHYSGKLLSEDGVLHLVLSADDLDRSVEAAGKHGFWCHRLLKVIPTPMQAPKRILMSLGRKKITTEESSMVIETGVRHHYSDEYISLTKDFYLDR